MVVVLFFFLLCFLSFPLTFTRPFSETRWFVEDDKWFVVQLEKVDKTLEWRRLFTPEYYAELAEAGNVTEQINLAIQMDQASKPDEGFKWWKRAADQGNPNAQTIVGSKFQEGIGTSKDEEKSQVGGWLSFFLSFFVSEFAASGILYQGCS